MSGVGHCFAAEMGFSQIVIGCMDRGFVVFKFNQFSALIRSAIICLDLPLI